MAKTQTVQLYSKTSSNLHTLTLERSENLVCTSSLNELSQEEFIAKVRGSLPPLPESSRPSSPSGPSQPLTLPQFHRNEDLHDANIFEDGESKKTTLAALDCTHWLEVMDERHRYGSYLRPYYDAWVAVGAPGSFFSWLDYGEGREVDFAKQGRLARKVVSRAHLEECRVEYCSEIERERYRVLIHDGLLVWASDNAPYGRSKYDVVDTNSEPKWIFVIDVSGKLYINRKRKGGFHHSSFVAGAPVRAAGRISVDRGIAVCIGPNSGHYRTTWEQLLNAVCALVRSSLNVVLPFPCATHEAHCIRVVPQHMLS